MMNSGVDLSDRRSDQSMEMEVLNSRQTSTVLALHVCHSISTIVKLCVQRYVLQSQS